MSKTHINLPVGFVDVAIREGWERSLAYWIITKGKYKNGTVYNCTTKRLAEVIGCSVGCAHHHLNVWLKQNIVRFHGNNLIFRSTRDLDEIALRNYKKEKSCRRRICLLRFDSVGEQLMCIQARTVLKNINQQVRNYRKKRETIAMLELANRPKPLSRDERAAYLRACKYRNKIGEKSLKSLSMAVHLSDGMIANLVGCGLSYAKGLKKFMELNGIIQPKVKKGGLIHDRMTKTWHQMGVEGGVFPKKSFYYKGRVYECPKTMYYEGYAVNMCSLKWLQDEALRIGRLNECKEK